MTTIEAFSNALKYVMCRKFLIQQVLSRLSTTQAW